jgi:hypothetical protein
VKAIDVPVAYHSSARALERFTPEKSRSTWGGLYTTPIPNPWWTRRYLYRLDGPFRVARVKRSWRSAGYGFEGCGGDREFTAMLRELRPDVGLPRKRRLRGKPPREQWSHLRALVRLHLEANGFEGVWIGDDIVLWAFPRLIPRLIATGWGENRPALARAASCVAMCARVRAEPRDQAEQVTQLLLGEPVGFGTTRGGWTRIRTAYGYRGWVHEGALGPPASRQWLTHRRGDVLDEARAYLGAPYEWGGITADGIDCSGLVHMAFRRLGVLVPRDSWQQEAAGSEVTEGDLRPGDLACYEGHVAFWLGGGRILHASGRAGVARVLEEPEPHQLSASFRSYRRLVTD